MWKESKGWGERSWLYGRAGDVVASGRGGLNKYPNADAQGRAQQPGGAGRLAAVPTEPRRRQRPSPIRSTSSDPLTGSEQSSSVTGASKRSHDLLATTILKLARHGRGDRLVADARGLLSGWGSSPGRNGATASAPGATRIGGCR